MTADSATRRVVKTAFGRVLNAAQYQRVQAWVMARDIRAARYSEPELEVVDHAVAAGDTVIDIGANYGMYSFRLSLAVGFSGNVLAFEPIPSTCASLRLVLRHLRLGNVQVIMKACGEELGSADFVVPIQSNGHPVAGLSHLGSRQANDDILSGNLRFERHEVVKCEVVTVDTVVPSSVDVSLIKLDIEGAELAALRGARQTIARCCPTIIAEVDPRLLNGFGLSVVDVFDYLAAFGYLPYRYNAGRLVVQGRPTISPGNVVFVHPSRQPRVSELIG